MKDIKSWSLFFVDAGVPSSVAIDYAAIFVEHRMQKSLLLDLTKDYLRDMGITATGDIIAILKHSKDIIAQEHKAKSLQKVTLEVPKEETSTVSVRKSTLVSEKISPAAAANRTLKHYIKPVSATGSPTISVQKEEVPVPTSRRVTPEIEGRYKISLPKGTTPKTRRILQQIRERDAAKTGSLTESGMKRSSSTNSVFARLGSTSQGVKMSGSGSDVESSGGIPSGLNLRITRELGGEQRSGIKRVVLSGASGIADETDAGKVNDSVFSRLGIPLKRKLESNVQEEEKEVSTVSHLLYQGIFKSGGTKQVRVESAGPGRMTRLHKEEVTSTSAGLLAGGAAALKPVHIKARLGLPIRDNAVSSTSHGVTQKKDTAPSGLAGRLGLRDSPAMQVKPARTAPGVTQKKDTAPSRLAGRLGLRDSPVTQVKPAQTSLYSRTDTTKSSVRDRLGMKPS